MYLFARSKHVKYDVCQSSRLLFAQFSVLEYSFDSCQYSRTEDSQMYSILPNTIVLTICKALLNTILFSVFFCNLGTLFYLLKDRKYNVGRKNCDIIIQKDQSISRQHAFFTVTVS